MLRCFGVLVASSITIEDSEAVLRAIRLTPADQPIDVILHTPGGHVRIYRPQALSSKLRRAGLAVVDVRYVHFIASIVWLRFCLTDFLRPSRPASGYEAAIMLAVAAERPVATWRTRLRSGIASSRFIAAIDATGALVWPKSFTFVARKSPRSLTSAAPVPRHRSESATSAE